MIKFKAHLFKIKKFKNNNLKLINIFKISKIFNKKIIFVFFKYCMNLNKTTYKEVILKNN